MFYKWTSANTPKIEDISQNVSICDNKNFVIAVAIAKFLFLQSGALWLIYSFYGVLGEVQC